MTDGHLYGILKLHFYATVKERRASHYVANLNWLFTYLILILDFNFLRNAGFCAFFVGPKRFCAINLLVPLC